MGNIYYEKKYVSINLPRHLPKSCEFLIRSVWCIFMLSGAVQKPEWFFKAKSHNIWRACRSVAPSVKKIGWTTWESIRFFSDRDRSSVHTDLQLDNIALKAKIYISSLFLCLNPFPCTLKILFPWVSFKCFYKIKTNIPRRYFKPINLLQLFHPENWYLFGENWLLVITLPASEFSAARETFLLWTKEARQFFTPTVLGHF